METVSKKSFSSARYLSRRMQGPAAGIWGGRCLTPSLQLPCSGGDLSIPALPLCVDPCFKPSPYKHPGGELLAILLPVFLLPGPDGKPQRRQVEMHPLGMGRDACPEGFGYQWVTLRGGNRHGALVLPGFMQQYNLMVEPWSLQPQCPCLQKWALKSIQKCIAGGE